ncbi:MAG TPA: ABC transporter permease [Jiangellaceae bacterium]|nr:ABC transporter permease [Jiangellaceae bacterium]
MLRATLKSLAARKLRLGLSAFAIVLGVAFVVGSFVFTDTLDETFERIFADSNSDVIIRPVVGEGDQFQFTGGDARTLPAAMVDDLADVEGVDRADGTVTNQSVFVIGSEGRLVGGTGAPGVATNWTDAPAEDGSVPLQVVDGREPRTADEVVLEAKTADRAEYEVGDQVTLVMPGDPPQLRARLVGITDFGNGNSLAGATLTLFDTRTAQDLLLDGEDVFNSIGVTAADDADVAELRDRIVQTLPDGVEALTGSELAEENEDAIQQALGFFNTFLLIFAAIALFVGIFLILNTFSILVAQRTQEMALFRALGAGRRQVTRSVLVEAVAVGLVGSTLGLLLGMGVAQLLKLAFALFGLDLGGAGLVLRPRTVLIAYAVGIVVTLVAAYVPARRAARVPPVAAMRDDVVFPHTSLRMRRVLGTVLTIAGAVSMGVGLFTEVARAGTFVGAGVAAVFVGVALLAPVVGPPIVRVIAGWFPRAFGTVGLLARENAQRNPRRTAATASALMIGLALVAAMSVIGQSTNRSIDRALDDGLKAQFVVSNAVGQPFSPALADRIAGLDGVAEVARVRYNAAQADGVGVFLAAFDPAAYAQAAELEISSGSDGLPSDGVLVSEDYARDQAVGVGDTVEIALPAATRDMEVGGIFASTQLLFADLVVGLDTLKSGGIRPADSTVYVVSGQGADPAEVRSGIEEAADELPMVAVKDQEAFKAEQRSQVNQLLYLVYALLGLAIIIAILGIVNTLALSVLERTREIGLLRAVGLSRPQLRRMVQLESVAIAVLGAVLGIGLGLLFGIALQRSQADSGLEVLAVPWVQLIIFVVLAAVVGVLAALWPAARAARLDVLRAITTE